MCKLPATDSFGPQVHHGLHVSGTIQQDLSKFSKSRQNFIQTSVCCLAAMEPEEITDCGIATLATDVDSKELLFASVLYNLNEK